MNLVNMQQTEEEAKEYGMVSAPGDAPKYPHGLCLCLNDGTLEKLGIKELPAVGSTLLVMAHATVTSVRSSQQMDGDKESGVDLQITEMALSAPTEKDAAALLYPDHAKG